MVVRAEGYVNKPAEAEPGTANAHPRQWRQILQGHNVMGSQSVISEEHDERKVDKTGPRKTMRCLRQRERALRRRGTKGGRVRRFNPPGGATHLAMDNWSRMLLGARLLARVEEEEGNRPVRSVAVEQRGHSPRRCRGSDRGVCIVFVRVRVCVVCVVCVVVIIGFCRGQVSFPGGGSQDGLWISGGREREGGIGKKARFRASAKISGCRSKGPLQRPLWVLSEE